MGKSRIVAVAIGERRQCRSVQRQPAIWRDRPLDRQASELVTEGDVRVSCAQHA
jgi:hypothetical protein